MALPAAIGLFLLVAAWPAVAKFGILAFADARWAPSSGAVGLAPMVLGTLVSGGLAIALAAPAAVSHALWVNGFAGAAAGPARAAMGVLAGLPSVVIGLIALIELVPLLRPWQPPGLGLAAATVVLTAMILPTAAVTADAAVAAVPPDAITAARGLGLGRWDAIRVVVIPTAWPGIRAGLVLALTRAFGETMAVMMVAGNTVAWPTGGPFRTLTGHVAVEMAYAVGAHRAALFFTGLVLLVGTAALIAPSAVRRTA